MKLLKLDPRYADEMKSLACNKRLLRDTIEKEITTGSKAVVATIKRT